VLPPVSLLAAVAELEESDDPDVVSDGVDAVSVGAPLPVSLEAVVSAGVESVEAAVVSLEVVGGALSLVAVVTGVLVAPAVSSVLVALEERSGVDEALPSSCGICAMVVVEVSSVEVALSVKVPGVELAVPSTGIVVQTPGVVVASPLSIEKQYGAPVVLSYIVMPVGFSGVPTTSSCVTM